MGTATQTADSSGDGGMTRRELFRRTGTIGAGAVAVMGGSATIVPRFSPVGRAQAVAPLVLYGAGAAGGAAVGWALGEWDPLEDDSPPEGLTVGALHEQTAQTIRSRQSTNASTMLDNQNIVDAIEHPAYGDGKVAAIEELNAESSQETVTNAGTAAVDDYGTTIVKNFLKSWNESVNELSNILSTLRDHPDTSVSDVFTTAGSEWHSFTSGQDLELDSLGISESTVTLPDGTDFAVQSLEMGMIDTDVNTVQTNTWDPTQRSSDDEHASISNSAASIIHADPEIRYLQFDDWNATYTALTDKIATVRDGIITWVDGVYGDVQSGDLDTEDLLTPRELAEMSADEEGVNQAIADLMALNIPVDLEREATITVQTDDGGTATMSGMLAPTDPPSDGIVSGETYNPANMSGDIYFNYDISQGSAEWTNYQTAVEDGTVTFTAEPYADSEFKITTAAGESAVVVDDDFTEDSSNSVWTVDISTQVDTATTEVDSVELTSESGETQHELIQLENEFVVEKIENSDGEEVDSSTFTQDEPQDDSNYVSQEEWEAMQERNQELIDKYEESKEDDGGFTMPTFFGDGGGGGILLIGAAAVLAFLGLQNNN